MTKNKIRILALVLAVLMLAVQLAACTPQEAPEVAVEEPVAEEAAPEVEVPTEEAAPAEEAPTEETAPVEEPAAEDADKYGGTLKLAYHSDIQRPNFLITSDGPAGLARDISQEKLFGIAADGSLVPRVATGYEVSDDGLTYTLHIREGITFQDGEPVTAHDVVFYHEYYEIIESVDKYTTPDVFTVEALDDYTVQFVFDSPKPFFGYEYGGYQILPEHIWKDADPTAWDTTGDPEMMIGIGPFKFMQYKAGEYMRYERYDDYWDGKPYLDGVVVQVISDTNARALAFETQQLDYGGVSKTSYELLKDNQEFKFVKLPSGNMSIVLLNQKDPRLADLAVRKALSYLVDRESMIIAQAAFASVMSSCITSADAFFDPGAADPEAFIYDVEKAKAVLDEAGWLPGSDGIREKDGQRLEFEILSWRPDANDLIVLMIDSAQKAGIALTLNNIDVSLFIERVFTEGSEDFALGFNGMTMGPDPSGYRDMYGKGVYTTYKNDEVNELFNQLYASTDEETMQSLMGQIQKIVTEERAALWLLQGDRVNGTTNGLNMDDCGLSGMYQGWISLSKAYFEK